MGKDLEFFPGVESWFDRINHIGKELGLDVEHYIISSGLHEIIEGSSIYSAFREVFACEFLYNENNVACWPKNAVNYTTKTQFLFRINKGVLDISNDFDLNKYTPEDDRRVPFRNMIYIGDGLTDVFIRKMATMWGSCSLKRGAVIFNLYLLKARIACIDYVVLHELTHFLYPNHSKQFYDFLSNYMPDWKERKRVLDQDVVHGL